MSLACAAARTPYHCGFRDGQQINGRSPELDLAGHELRVVEEIGNEAPLRRDAAADRCHGLGQDGVARALARVQEDVRPARDDRERSPQLVRDGGHELVLQVVGRFGALACVALQLKSGLAVSLGAPYLGAILDGE